MSFRIRYQGRRKRLITKVMWGSAGKVQVSYWAPARPVTSTQCQTWLEQLALHPLAVAWDYNYCLVRNSEESECFWQGNSLRNTVFVVTFFSTEEVFCSGRSSQHLHWMHVAVAIIFSTQLFLISQVFLWSRTLFTALFNTVEGPQPRSCIVQTLPPHASYTVGLTAKVPHFFSLS